MKKEQKFNGIEELKMFAWIILSIGSVMGGIAFLNVAIDGKITLFTNVSQILNNTFLILGFIFSVFCWAFFLVVCTIAESLLKIQKIIQLQNTDEIVK